MKTPKSQRGYLKLLITIANDSSDNLSQSSREGCKLISGIRADIQNELGENRDLLQLYHLDYTGD